MTKAERAHVAALEKDLAEARAFRRTEPVKPDVPPPGESSMGRMTFGFLHNTYDLKSSADPAASTSIGHYKYYDGKRMGGSQRGISLCSTRLLALQVARCEMERSVARALAKLDAEIEHERANPTPRPEHDA